MPIKKLIPADEYKWAPIPVPERVTGTLRLPVPEKL
jgi:hypothetical protein